MAKHQGLIYRVKRGEKEEEEEEEKEDLVRHFFFFSGRIRLAFWTFLKGICSTYINILLLLLLLSYLAACGYSIARVNTKASINRKTGERRRKKEEEQWQLASGYGKPAR